jgi:hypothetical protein
MVSQVTAALVDFTAKAIAQVVVVSISPFCGSESESGESQQAVERLTGLGGSLRVLIPCGYRGEKGANGGANGDRQPATSTKPVAGEGPAPAP